MDTKLDYLIVGGGLAGSILGWRLHRQGAKIRIVDNNPAVNASKTAAGLINPITGKRLVKTCNFETLHAEALKFYKSIEAQFDEMLYFDMPLVRLFKSKDAMAVLDKRLNDESYRPYIGKIIEPEDSPFKAPFGGFEILQAGYLDTNQLLEILHQYFQHEGVMEYGDFKYGDLKIKDTKVSWRTYQARKVIFCEGYRLASNPWFGDLPLQGSKGEILSVEIDGLEMKQMVNGGQWLIPRTDGSYRLGATHSWHAQDEEITAQDRKELLDGFHKIIAGDYSPRVTMHRAGVRPATKDRQPFVGVHKTHPQLSIFNGFGAKGSLLIPWHAKQFAAFLSNESELPAESDIKRFD